MIDALTGVEVTRTELLDDTGVIQVHRIVFDGKFLGRRHQRAGPLSPAAGHFHDVAGKIQELTLILQRRHQAVGHHRTRHHRDSFNFVSIKHQIVGQIRRRPQRERRAVLPGDESPVDIAIGHQHGNGAVFFVDRSRWIQQRFDHMFVRNRFAKTRQVGPQR